MSPSTSSSALTFGIEIEAIFAFHESRMEDHLSISVPGAKIIKTIDSIQERGLRQTHYKNKTYNSWALSDAGENDMTVERTVEHESGLIRAYKDEPLHLVKELLLSKDCTRDIKIHNPVDHSKPSEYNSWILTSDHSLTSLSNEEKSAHLLGTLNEPSNWDSSGIELVSPPYSSTTKAQTDISAILTFLVTTTSSITTNTSCGLHVHIGTPSGHHLPLKTLQNLAYILFIYEDAIGTLHPGHRRQRADEIGTNRENFYAEGDEPVERTLINQDTGETVTKLFDCTYKSLEWVRHSIFDEVNRAESPIEALQLRMGKKRNHIVNFAYLNRRDGPQTIEFRQHAGSVDAVEIGFWVEFCLGLVRLAERYADGDGECTVRSWDDKIDVEDLFEEIGLSGEGRCYYRGKIMEYAVDAPEPIELWQEAWEDDEEEGSLF
jgi:hypothetical protein